MEEEWATTVEAEASGKDGTRAQIPLALVFFMTSHAFPQFPPLEWVKKAVQWINTENNEYFVVIFAKGALN